MDRHLTGRLLLVLLAALLAWPASADWVVRPVALNLPSLISADVVVSGGQVVVGYSTLGDYRSAPTTLARLGDPLWSYQQLNQNMGATALATDPQGRLYMAGTNSQGIVYVGQDLGMWGGLQIGPANQTCFPMASPRLAVNSRGVPAIAMPNANTSNGSVIYSQFNVPTGTWASETLTTKVSSPFGCALAFDENDHPIVTAAADSNQITTLVTSRKTDGSWMYSTVGQADMAWGMSMAYDSDRGVAVAYVNAAQTLCVWTASQTYNLGVPRYLAPHSLAFDPSGQLILADTDTNGHHAVLTTMGPAGTSTQTLPTLPSVSSPWVCANLAFDAQGKPLVLCSNPLWFNYPGAVALVGQDLPVLMPGDANGDDKVAFDDYLTLEAAFGTASAIPDRADFNLDGKVDFSDYLILEANFGRVTAIPEPITLTILAAGLGLLSRRRR